MPLVPIATYRDPVQAHLARALLESAGIAAHIADEHTIGVNWEYSQALGGARLLVAPEAEIQARELLDAEVAEAETGAGVEPPSADLARDAPTCPRCAAAGERLAGLDRRVRAASMLLPLPIALGRYRVRCGACGHHWRDAPPHRGLRYVLGDLLALLLLAAASLVTLAIRGVRAVLLPRQLECWACGTAFPWGEPRCPTCSIALPRPTVHWLYVRRGRVYDGTCERCHLPFASSDYLAGAARRCSSCKAPLPDPTT